MSWGKHTHIITSKWFRFIIAKITYSVILSVLSNKSNMILRFSSSLSGHLRNPQGWPLNTDLTIYLLKITLNSSLHPLWLLVSRHPLWLLVSRLRLSLQETKVADFDDAMVSEIWFAAALRDMLHEKLQNVTYWFHNHFHFNLSTWYKSRVQTYLSVAEQLTLSSLLSVIAASLFSSSFAPTIVPSLWSPMSSLSSLSLYIKICYGNVDG